MLGHEHRLSCVCPTHSAFWRETIRQGTAPSGRSIQSHIEFAQERPSLPPRVLFPQRVLALLQLTAFLLLDSSTRQRPNELFCERVDHFDHQ